MPTSVIRSSIICWATPLTLEQLCAGDPLLRNLSTAVISAQIYKPPAAPSGGKKAHQKQAKATAEPILASPCLQVVLHDTILFPEGGGQPSDVGIMVTDDGQVWEVALIKRHGLTAVHYVELQPDTSIENVPSVFEPGRKVSVELGEEGFKRRLDHVCRLSRCFFPYTP